MKTPLAILLVSCGLLACKKEDAGKVAATIGQPFDLAEQQTTTLPTNGSTSLSITLTQVRDSRCPSNMTCLVAGYAVVDVALTDAIATPQTARISFGVSGLPNYTRDSVSVVLNQQKYWLRLLDVKPYPTGASGQTKFATLRLRPY